MFLIRLFATLFEIATIVGGVIGSFFLYAGLMPGQTAIQNAAGAALAVACVALPYCVAGVFHRMSMRALKVEQVDAIFGD